MCIGVISHKISNLQTHAEQSRARASLHDGCQCWRHFKAIVSFYRVNSDRAFERHRSRILINDLNTVHALKKHLIQFLGLKERTLIYGLGDFDSHFFPLRECGTAGTLVLHSFHIHIFLTLIIVDLTAGAGD